MQVARRIWGANNAGRLATRSLSDQRTSASPAAAKDKNKVSLPPFDDEFASKYTHGPNPSWSWGQKIDSTPLGREWMEGEKQGWKTVTTAQEDPSKLYALMISGVVPRPIALVSTVSAHGVENLAPFSWFGMITNWPPVVGIACLHAPKGNLKDTVTNVKNSAGFVVNIISEPFIHLANATSIDAPADVDEWALSGLTKLPCIDVKASRVKESAFSMECQLYQTIPIVDPASETGAYGTTLILGHVKHIHVRRDMLTERGTVDATKFKPVARLGDNSYGRVGDAYKLTRPSWATDEAEIRGALDKRLGRDVECGERGNRP